MACIVLCSFGSGTATAEPFTFPAGAFSLDSVTFRSVGYSLRINPTTTATGSVRICGPNALNYNVVSAYHRFYFRYAVKPATAGEIMAQPLTTSGGVKAELRLNSDGTMSLYDRLSTTLIDTGTTALLQDIWYCVELGISGRDYTLRIDENTEFSGTAAVGSLLESANHGFLRLGKPTDRNGNSVDFYYADVFIDDAAFPGIGTIKLLVPDANGSTMEWISGSGTDYTVVDEIPASGVDYLQSSVAGQVALLSFGDLGVTGTINAVALQCFARNSVSGTAQFAARLRSAGTNSDSSTTNLGTNYVYRGLALSTDPATGLAWTVGGVDALEGGAVDGSGGTVRLRLGFAALAVDYKASSGGGGTPILTHYRKLMEIG